MVATDPPPGERVLTGATVQVDVSKGPERYEVPDLANVLPAQASSLLEAKNLVAGGQALEYSETIPAGRVIRSEPAATESVKPGTEVMLVVSQGRQSFPIPNVEGATMAEAQATLEAAGFEPILEPEEFSDTVPAGSVIRQSDVGGQGYRGDGVHLVPSKGPELFAVPNVKGRQQSDAEAILTELGFEVDYTYPPWGPVFRTVAGQDVAEGTMLPRGSIITLQIV